MNTGNVQHPNLFTLLNIKCNKKKIKTERFSYIRVPLVSYANFTQWFSCRFDHTCNLHIAAKVKNLR